MNPNKPRNSAATERALALVAKGWPPFRAARYEEIDPSTIYRALRRQREASARQQQREVK